MRHDEQSLQVAVVNWLKIAAPDLLCFAVPNAIGVKNAARIGAINKSMGVRPGVTDLVFYIPVKVTRFYTVAVPHGIELKSVNGRQTPAQKDFEAACKRVGAPYAICRSLEDVEGTLKGWGIKLHGSLS